MIGSKQGIAVVAFAAMVASSAFAGSNSAGTHGAGGTWSVGATTGPATGTVYTVTVAILVQPEPNCIVKGQRFYFLDPGFLPGAAGSAKTADIEEVVPGFPVGRATIPFDLPPVTHRVSPLNMRPHQKGPPWPGLSDADWDRVVSETGLQICAEVTFQCELFDENGRPALHTSVETLCIAAPRAG